MKDITKNQQKYLNPVAKCPPAPNNLLILCAAAQFVEGTLLDNSSYKNFAHSETGPFKAYTQVEDTNLQTSNAFFARQEFKRRIPAVNEQYAQVQINLSSGVSQKRVLTHDTYSLTNGHKRNKVN